MLLPWDVKWFSLIFSLKAVKLRLTRLAYKIKVHSASAVNRRQVEKETGHDAIGKAQ